MRYYQIVITNPQTGKIVVPASLQGAQLPYFTSPDATYSSLVNGRFLPNALNIELDVFVFGAAQPAGASYVRVWGVSLQEISQSHNLDNFPISVYGGMSKGLPLANPIQAGLLFQGFIFQSFGNWIGTDMSLDLIVAANIGTAANPKNISVSWKKGTPLSTGIAQVFAQAFPDLKPQIAISDKLVYPDEQPFVYQTLEQFAAWIKQISQSIIGGSYPGVDIYISNNSNVIYALDGTQPFPTALQSATNQPKQILFSDLIGQPTWIDSPVIQFKTPMRADISIGDIIRLPQALVTTTQAAYSSQQDLQSAFQGAFWVTLVRHVGNYRQPTADSWVSVFNATPVTSTVALH